MNRSDNKFDTDWKKEWDDEQKLTPEEQKQAKMEQDEYDRIYQDYMLSLVEAEYREDDNQRLLDAMRDRWEQKARSEMDEYADFTYEDVWGDP